MPFGPIFGALFFGFVCGWFGLSLLAHPQGAGRMAGISLLVLGASLALGLLRRRPWARWAGVAAAVLLGLLALRMVVLEGRLLDHVALYSAVATAVALAFPATGRAPAPREAGTAKRRDFLQLTTALGLLGLLGAGWWSASDVRPSASHAHAQSALPASSVSQRVRWHDFESGMELARTEGRPALVTFVTDWCPYCTKMEKGTWRAPEVVARMAGLVAVKVDADEEQALAMRYEVNGLPGNLLLDGDGKVIARRDGYLTASQLISWIDRSVGRTTEPASRAAL
jgi:thiol:disulfide interchange protein